MPVNILMPALSPTMEKGNLAKWVKKEGDKVKAGDVIAEIETDKATMEVEAVDDGTLGKIVVAEGTQDVPVNQVIAVLLEEGEDAGAIKAPPAAKPAPKAEAKQEAKPVVPAERASSAREPGPSAAKPQTVPDRGLAASADDEWARRRPHFCVTSCTPARERFRHRRFARAGFRTARPCCRAGRRGSKEGRRAARAAGGCGRGSRAV